MNTLVKTIKGKGTGIEGGGQGSTESRTLGLLVAP